MPLRRYIVLKADGSEGEEFEVELPADAPDFERHPVTGDPCRRVVESPTLTLRYGDGAMKGSLNDRRLARAGFRRLEKDGQGGWNQIN
jgi:hypothetical protein